MDEKLRVNTNLVVEVMNSKQHVTRKLRQEEQIAFAA